MRVAEAPAGRSTRLRVIRLALITDRAHGSRCDGRLASAVVMRQAASAAGMRRPQTTVMYRRSPPGLKPAPPSFIVHLLSPNEPFGTHTISAPLVLRASRITVCGQLYAFMRLIFRRTSIPAIVNPLLGHSCYQRRRRLSPAGASDNSRQLVLENITPHEQIIPVIYGLQNENTKRYRRATTVGPQRDVTDSNFAF